jgi:hypothetical protein
VERNGGRVKRCHDLRGIRAIGSGVRFALLGGVMRALIGLFSLAFCLTLSAANTPAPAHADVQPALERFLSRPDEPLKAYRATRRLEGHNERFNMHGAIEAMTELLPDGRFEFTIVSETGADYIRDKVLRPILETEAKVLASGSASRSAMTTENYEIGGGELAEPGLVKLFAKPRRKDVSLIDGAVFITSDESDLVRIEGRMAKNPSFWTTRVNLVRHYDRVAGVRVPIRLDSTAQIRLAGESTLSMVYDYESINGVKLE